MPSTEDPTLLYGSRLVLNIENKEHGYQQEQQQQHSPVPKEEEEQREHSSPVEAIGQDVIDDKQHEEWSAKSLPCLSAVGGDRNSPATPFSVASPSDDANEVTKISDGPSLLLNRLQRPESKKKKKLQKRSKRVPSPLILVETANTATNIATSLMKKGKGNHLLQHRSNPTPRSLEELQNERSYLTLSLHRQRERAARMYEKLAALKATLASTSSGPGSTTETPMMSPTASNLESSIGSFDSDPSNQPKKLSRKEQRRRAKKEVALLQSRIAENTKQEQLVAFRLGEVTVEMQDRERWTSMLMGSSPSSPFSPSFHSHNHQQQHWLPAVMADSIPTTPATPVAAAAAAAMMMAAAHQQYQQYCWQAQHIPPSPSFHSSRSNSRDTSTSATGHGNVPQSYYSVPPPSTSANPSPYQFVLPSPLSASSVSVGRLSQLSPLSPCFVPKAAGAGTTSGSRDGTSFSESFSSFTSHGGEVQEEEIVTQPLQARAVTIKRFDWCDDIDQDDDSEGSNSQYHHHYQNLGEGQDKEVVSDQETDGQHITETVFEDSKSKLNYSKDESQEDKTEDAAGKDGEDQARWSFEIIRSDLPLDEEAEEDEDECPSPTSMNHHYPRHNQRRLRSSSFADVAVPLSALDGRNNRLSMPCFEVLWPSDTAMSRRNSSCLP